MSVLYLGWWCLSSPVQHFFRLEGVAHDADDLVLTDQDPVPLGDVKGVDVASPLVTDTLRKITAQVLDEHGVGRDLTGRLRAVLLLEGDEQRVVVGEGDVEDGGEREFGGVHGGIVSGLW